VGAMCRWISNINVLLQKQRLSCRTQFRWFTIESIGLGLVNINLWVQYKKNRFQNKVLRHMANAPWYIRNNDLHRDLQVDVVTSDIQSFAQKHEGRLHHHEKAEAIQLLDNTRIVRRLQRKKKTF